MDGRMEGWKAEYYFPMLFFKKAGDKNVLRMTILVHIWLLIPLNAIVISDSQTTSFTYLSSR